MQLQTTLSPRVALLGAGALLACLLAVAGLSFERNAETANRRLRAARQQTLQLQRDREVFLAIQNARTSQLSREEAVNAATRPQGVLYSLVEQGLAQAKLTPQVQYLRPDSKKEDELFVNESVSLALRQLDRRQLIAFFQATERGIPGINLENFSLNRTKEGFADVNAVFSLRTAK